MKPNEKEATLNLQRYLRQLALSDQNIPEVPIDGIFGNATRKAIIAFQRIENLPPTGVANQITFELLYRRYRESLSAQAAPEKISFFFRFPSDYAVKEGDVGFLVLVIQYMLRELSAIYDGLEATPQTGKYDEDTAQSVKALQRKHGLTETGTVDLRTWNALAQSYNRIFEDSLYN